MIVAGSCGLEGGGGGGGSGGGGSEVGWMPVNLDESGMDGG